jgi:hypothetical protein
MRLAAAAARSSGSSAGICSGEGCGSSALSRAGQNRHKGVTLTDLGEQRRHGAEHHQAADVEALREAGHAACVKDCRTRCQVLCLMPVRRLARCGTAWQIRWC